MTPLISRTLLLTGLAVVFLLIFVLGLTWVLWGWPPVFEVKGMWWS